MDYIPLSKGRGVAVVDSQDYEWLCKYQWYSTYNGYARTSIGGKTVGMHRLIMDAPPGKDVDHINFVKMDNRRENLRLCSRSENKLNNNAKGYSWHKQSQKWHARITIDYKDIHLGLFDTEEEASEAYLKVKESHRMSAMRKS